MSWISKAIMVFSGVMCILSALPALEGQAPRNPTTAVQSAKDDR
jgi:hypothetical protein